MKEVIFAELTELPLGGSCYIAKARWWGDGWPGLGRPALGEGSITMAGNEKERRLGAVATVNSESHPDRADPFSRSRR